VSTLLKRNENESIKGTKSKNNTTKEQQQNDLKRNMKEKIKIVI